MGGTGVGRLRPSRPRARKGAVGRYPRSIEVGCGTQDQTHRSRAARVARSLRAAYGDADLGNLADPIDELVFISLSRQTHAVNARRSWEAVCGAGGPRGLLHMPVVEVQHIIGAGGLSRQKAAWISASLNMIERRFGRLSLDETASWSDAELEGFLRSLPGLGIKSAKCIMLYSMSRQVLPVDVHVRRVATRLGLVAGGISDVRSHELLEDLVSPPLRYAFHVNAIWHGRQICRARTARCGVCVIATDCPSAA